jgi:hypothetical protein
VNAGELMTPAFFCLKQELNLYLSTTKLTEGDDAMGGGGGRTGGL